MSFHRLYYAIQVPLLYVSPVLITAFLNVLWVKLILKFKKQHEIIISKVTQSKDPVDSLTRCLMYLTTFFLFSVTPHSLYLILYQAKIRPCAVLQVGYKTQALSILNSSMYFVIYFWKLESFRNAVKQSVSAACCCRRRENPCTEDGSSDPIQSLSGSLPKNAQVT